MNLTNRFFRLARIVSYKSKSQVRIGAVLTKNRKIISLGYNDMEKTHPVMAKLSEWKKIHAELDALIGTSRYDLSGATMFVYRDQRDGNVGMCKPCEDCQILMKRAGIYSAYYTDPNLPGAVGYIDLRKEVKSEAA